jgi:hypothetical protein
MAIQPTLPAEVAPTELEQEFISSSPFDLWPAYQNSNIGQIRKVMCDQMQDRADFIDQLALESFVPTSSLYLSLWEEMYGIPVNESATDETRRAAILAQMGVGGFTRSRVRYILDKYLTPMIGGGEAPAFTPEGIAHSAGGIPLYGGVTSMIGAYKIYEHPTTFSYEVWIKSGLTPPAALLAQLQRITPAGITVTLDNTHLNVIDFARTIETDQPLISLPLATNMTDSSPNGLTGTLTSATAIANPGLLAHTDVAGGLGSRDLNGTTEFGVSTNFASNNRRLNVFWDGQWEIEIMVRPDAIGSIMTIMGLDTSVSTPNLRVNADGTVEVVIETFGSLVKSTTSLSSGTIYMLHVSRPGRGLPARIYINNVDVTGFQSVIDTVTVSPGELQIGRRLGGTQFWNGGIGRFALYDRPLTTARRLQHYNAAKNIQMLG